jgi:DNA-binding beta-propeller fold protein YncE
MMGGALAAGTEPLVLERTIPLGGVSGRIDHLAVDLKEGRLLKTLTGFREPQGMGYVPATNELYVANGGDGTVRIFGGDELSFRGQCALGDDADNVRVTTDPARVIVGYGRGGLAVIDPVSHGLKAKVEFKGHPEGFQILPGSGQAVVNIPMSMRPRSLSA